MGSMRVGAARRRWAVTLGASAVLAAAVLGGSGAIAQSDDAATGTGPDALLERLDALEDALPSDVPPAAVALAPDTTWGELQGDAASANVLLETVAEELRRLFVDADEAAGSAVDPETDVARAVALVAQGWLDVWHGTASLATAESNDLAFPIATFDSEGVATGADELRGEMEIGLELVLQGRARHLDGYAGLRTLGAAPAAVQARFDARAADAEAFDTQVRPYVVAMLSQPTTGVLVPTERFETDAPGVTARARAVTMVCIDREALAAAGGVLTDEALAELGDAEVTRPDCPGPIVEGATPEE